MSLKKEHEVIARLNKKLTLAEKKAVTRLVADVMESAYRRAVQQTLHLKDKDAILSSILDDPYKYRYGKDLITSCGLDGFKTSSIERLLMEHPWFGYFGDDAVEAS